MFRFYANYLECPIMLKKCFEFVGMLVCAGLILLAPQALNSQTDCLDIQFDIQDAGKGDEICVDVIVNNFDDIELLQHSIRWDPSVLEYVGTRNFNLKDLTQIGERFAASGILIVVWFDFDATGVTVPNGTVIYQMCFKVIGQPGDSTPIFISDDPREYLASNSMEDVPLCDDNSDKIVHITEPAQLCALSTACGTESNDGSIKITVWGGTPPYTYSGAASGTLNNPGEMILLNNLTSGQYSVTVRDGAGADTTIVIDLGNYPALMIDSIDLIQPSCDSSSLGSIITSVTGGLKFKGRERPPYYNISWTPGNTFSDTVIRDIAQGIYTITAKDSLGCSVSRTFNLESTTIDLSHRVLRNATCDGAANGAVEIIVSGGVTPYGFSSDGTVYLPIPGDRFTLASLNPGMHTIYVRDDQGCIKTITFEILADNALGINVVQTDVSCFGGSDGSLVITGVTNGTSIPPYFFNLSDEFDVPVNGGANDGTTYTSPGLTSGTYHFLLRDFSGCEFRDTFTLTQPAPIQLNLIDQDTIVSCSPGSDGFIEVQATGGTGPNYQYRWLHNNGNGQRTSSLDPGQYQVEITDNNNCVDTFTYNVIAPTRPQITHFDTTHVSCTGEMDGSLTVHYNNGTGTVNNFTWSNSGSGATVNSLGVGNYCVTISDENNCRDTACVDIISAFNQIRIDSFALDTPDCFGYPGNIAVFASGGGAPFTYIWSTGDTLVGSAVLPAVDAGTYYVTVEGTGSCAPAIDTIVLPQPPEIEIEILLIDSVSCASDTTCDGRAAVRVKGGPERGAAGYTVYWSSGEISNADTLTPAAAFFLCGGRQSVVVVSGNCASDSLFFDVPVPDPVSLNLNVTNVLQPSCYGLADGQITAMAQGGEGPYTYFWPDQNVNGPVVTGVTEGTYYVEITDANNCVGMDSVTVLWPERFDAEVAVSGTRDVTCNGGNDGRIAIIWSGGNPGPAQYDWSPAVSNDSIATDLSPGNYQIIVTDDKNCMDTVDYTIDEPAPVQATIPTPDSIYCFGDRTNLTVTGARGGNGPLYRFTINSGSPQNLTTLVPVFAGSYDITVFDARGCAFDTTIVIGQAPPFSVEILESPPITIGLGETTTLTGSLKGRPINPSMIEWLPVDSVKSPFNLITDVTPNRTTTYTLTVWDENGCSQSAEIEVIVESIRKVALPNIFTPNGDNLNDLFRVYGGKGVKLIRSFNVFNRWGDLVYSDANIPEADFDTRGWDGTWNGKPLNPDVFVYVIEVEFIDDTRLVYRGDVTLIR